MKRGSVGKSRGYARLFHFHDSLCYQRHQHDRARRTAERFVQFISLYELSNPLEVKSMYPLETLICVHFLGPRTQKGQRINTINIVY